MSIVPLQRLLNHARSNGYAVGYFEAWDQYSMEAVLEAAEELRSPAILGFGGAVTNPAWYDRNGVEEMAALATCLAARATVPAAVLFNEARTYAHAVRGLKAGCNAVMLDSSHLSYREHTDLTARLVEVAHAVGAAVEAELGHLANAADASHVAEPTDPVEAVLFAAATGVDALAVSVGNVHELAEGEATVDLELLERIHRAVRLPLVIHGGTGFPRAAVADAVRLGAAKFNVGTILKQVFLEGVRAACGQQAAIHDLIGSRASHDILRHGKERMMAQIVELIQLYGSAGQATSS